jgi:hypothetical protein
MSRFSIFLLGLSIVLTGMLVFQQVGADPDPAKSSLKILGLPFFGVCELFNVLALLGMLLRFRKIAVLGAIGILLAESWIVPVEVLWPTQFSNWGFWCQVFAGVAALWVIIAARNRNVTAEVLINDPANGTESDFISSSVDGKGDPPWEDASQQVALASGNLDNSLETVRGRDVQLIQIKPRDIRIRSGSRIPVRREKRTGNAAPNASQPSSRVKREAYAQEIDQAQPPLGRLRSAIEKDPFDTPLD